MLYIFYHEGTLFEDPWNQTGIYFHAAKQWQNRPNSLLSEWVGSARETKVVDAVIIAAGAA